MTARSRLPNNSERSREDTAFLDNLDKKQQAISQIAPLGSGATLADVIAKVNAIISSQT